MDNIEYRCTIKELPKEERPREKLLKYGAEQLSNAELLAIIIRLGIAKRTAVELSQDVLNYFNGLKGLVELKVEELMKLKGIGTVKASQILALIELSKRIHSSSFLEQPVIQTPKDVVSLIMPKIRFLKQEVFGLVLLDIKNKVIATPLISKGGLSSSIVHPREVFKIAIKRSSAATILFHNHPSGEPTPSQDDIKITKRLIKVGEIIGINVLDHIVIGDNKFISMKEEEFI